jgi:hypothetical protein
MPEEMSIRVVCGVTDELSLICGYTSADHVVSQVVRQSCVRKCMIHESPEIHEQHNGID